MALIVITLQDEEDGRVNLSAVFEPKPKKKPTPAQISAVRMIEAARGDADEED